MLMTKLPALLATQLVVPVKNARYALNAANAVGVVWHDALYGNDVISEEDGADKGKGYNPVRGAKVIAYARTLFRYRRTFRTAGSHADSVAYAIVDGVLQVTLKTAAKLV